MRYIDPHPVTCSRCGSESEQRVADLLALRASCPTCAAAMLDIGRGMRAAVDDWSAFVTWAQISVAVEEKLGVQLDDAYVFERNPHSASLTLDDLAHLVQDHLPPDSAGADRARAMVLEAARTLPDANVGMNPFALPILDAVFPDRWTTTVDNS